MSSSEYLSKGATVSMFLFNAQATTVYLAKNMYILVYLFSDKWRLIDKTDDGEPK